MPAKYRVSRADFKRMRGFKRLNGSLFSLSWGEIPGRTAVGAAVVVSKKAAALATERTTIKRRARVALLECVRPQKPPMVFVAIAKKPARGALLADIRSDIQGLVARAVSSR